MKKNIIIVKLQLSRDIIRRELGLLIFDRKKKTDFDLAQTKSLLFIRNDAKLGDAIVSSCVIQKIRKYRPDIKIMVMTTANMTDLFKQGFGVDEVIHLKKRPSYSEIKSVCEKLGPIDVAVSLNPDMKMKDIYLHRCLQSKVNIGLDKRVKLVNNNIADQISHAHYAMKFDHIAKELGIEAKQEKYIVPLKQVSLDKVDAFLKTNAIQDYILFNPFGSGSTRKLIKANIQKIIEGIHHKEPHCQVVLLSSPDTRAELDKMGVCDNNKFVFHFDQSDSIYDAIAAVERAESVITVDTSIVHIAAGLSKKQVAIYKNEQENFQSWGPNSDLAIPVFTAVDDINEVNTTEIVNSVV